MKSIDHVNLNKELIHLSRDSKIKTDKLETFTWFFSCPNDTFIF